MVKKIILKKILMIILILMLILALLLIYNEQSNGYQISIYSEHSLIVWVILVSTIIVSIGGILVESQNSKNGGKFNHLWFFLFFASGIIASLGYLTGYAFIGRHDALTNLGEINYIITHGHFYFTNLYPIMHIILAETALITNFSSMKLAFIFPLFFYFFFIMSIYLLARFLFKSKIIVILAVISSTFFLLGKYFMESYYLALIPNSFADFLIPLILLTFLSYIEKFKIICIIFVFLIPFFHPLTTIFLAITFFSIILISTVLNKLNIGKKSQFSLIPLLILLCVFITWLSSFLIWNMSWIRIVNFIKSQITFGSTSSGLSTSLSTLNLNLSDLLLFLVKLFLPNFLFFVLSIISLIIIIRNFQKHSNYVIIMNFCFVILLIIPIVFLFVPLGFESTRAINYAIIFTILLGSFTLNHLLNKKYGIIFVMIILIFSLVFGIISLYNSPSIYRPNQQVTNMELVGNSWFFNNNDPKFDISSIMSTNYYRFADVTIGIDKTESKYNRGYINVVPDHFGYDKSIKVGDSFNKPTYIPLSEHDEILYIQTWPQVHRYSESDFQKIKFDQSLNKVYNNNGFRVWLID